MPLYQGDPDATFGLFGLRLGRCDEIDADGVCGSNHLHHFARQLHGIGTRDDTSHVPLGVDPDEHQHLRRRSVELEHPKRLESVVVQGDEFRIVPESVLHRANLRKNGRADTFRCRHLRSRRGIHLRNFGRPERVENSLSGIAELSQLSRDVRQCHGFDANTGFTGVRTGR